MKKACVIGWPIKHSRSPLIHGHWLEKYGIEGSYTKQAVSPDNLELFLDKLRQNGWSGCNVTVPHKEAVFRLADIVHDEARAIEAANTLWWDADRLLHASNTDIYGFITHLNQSAPGWNENERPVAVLGAGGAARGIVYGLVQSGASQIRLLNRTRERADELAAYYEGTVNVADWRSRNEELEGCGLVVNSTSLGMEGSASLDLSLESLEANAVVADIVYAPLETPLLAAARQKGCRTVDGLGMLLHQAVPGFEHWFGVRPQVTDELRNLVIADLTG